MTGTGEENQPKVEESHAQVPSASSSDPQAPEVDQEKWGTHIMGPPAIPTCHPDNQKAALWRAEDQREEFHPQPYVVYSPIDKPSNNPLESVVNMFNSWSNRAETIARNIWHNLKAGPSVTEAAWGKLNLTAKALTEGGFEPLYKQIFPADPNEQLKKTFACYLSIKSNLTLSPTHVCRGNARQTFVTMEKRIVRRRGACNQCKIRKLRCDGFHPKCGTCEKQNSQCVYDKQYSSQKHRSGPRNANSSIVLSSPIAVHNELHLQTSEYVPDSIDINQNQQLPTPEKERSTSFSRDGYQDSLSSLELREDDVFHLLGEDESQLAVCREHDAFLLSCLRDEGSAWELSPPFATTMLSEIPYEMGHLKQKADDLSRESPTLAGLLNLNLEKLQGCQQHHLVSGLFEKVIHKLLTASIHTDVQSNDEDAEVTRRNQAEVKRLELQQYISAYFREYHSQYPFIAQREFPLIVESFLNQDTSICSSQIALVNSILAIGCLTVKSRAQSFDAAHIEAEKYLDAALKSQSESMRGGATIIKIQALTAMAIASQVLSRLPQALSCISCAAQHALHLRLNNFSRTEYLAKNFAEKYLLQKIFCVIYSIEKPLSMRLDCCSMINDDFVDYSFRSIQRQESLLDFSETRDQHLLMGIYCDYAHLCSLVMKSLYAANPANSPRMDPQDAVLFLVNSLEKWKLSALPPSNKLENNHNSWATTSTPEVLERQQMALRLKYHELKFAIHHNTYTSIQAAKDILADAHNFQLTASESDWAMIRIPMVACCVLLIEIFSETTLESRRQSMLFVAMASGWFGRLSMATSKDVGFMEFMDLIGLAQQQVRTP